MVTANAKTVQPKSLFISELRLFVSNPRARQLVPLVAAYLPFESARRRDTAAVPRTGPVILWSFTMKPMLFRF
jgi:hypothetical protein